MDIISLEQGSRLRRHLSSVVIAFNNLKSKMCYILFVTRAKYKRILEIIKQNKLFCTKN